jgi:hypothetical protein
MERNSDE